MALACRPALWAKADTPTYACCGFGALLASSATACATRISSGRCPSGRTCRPIFSSRFPITANRSALPGRSPYPLAVPCTWVAPASTAARELATAQAVSFCACMPTRKPVRATTSATVRPVVGVAVEEVLAVEEHPAALGDQEAHGVGHHRQVLLRRGAQRLPHVPQVGLGDQADDRGLRVPQRQHLRVGRRARPGLAGGAERDQLCVPHRQLGPGPGEELGVLRQRAGPAALDESDTELVEQPRDGELVGDREGHALTLRAVAQGGVVDVERVVEHGFSPGKMKKTSRGCGRSARWRGAGPARYSIMIEV